MSLLIGPHNQGLASPRKASWLAFLRLTLGSRVRRLVLVVAVAAVLLVFPAESSRGCQLCSPYPRESPADHLLAAETVVLAREDPDRPFHFATIEVLKGDPGDARCELFLDSGTRRMLAVHPDRSVVLTLRRGENGAVTWRRVGVADDDFGPIVRSILAADKDWRTDPGRRFDFFAEWLGHANLQVWNLAHLEITRAPYRRILDYRDAVSRAEIYRFLDRLRYTDWHPLYILLLAAKDHPEDHETIRQSFHSSARLSLTRTLQAWTAAYIQIAEAEAIEAVEEHYFRRAGRSPEEIKAVLQALSVHGSGGHVHLRDRILTSYAVLLEQYPERAVDLLKDLKAWKRADLTPAITAIVSKRPSSVDFQAMRQLRSYLLLQMRGNLRTARVPVLP